LLEALSQGRDPAPADEDLADRLAAAAAQRPAVGPENLLGEVRVLLVWLNEERTRRDLRQFGRLLPDVDRETARSLDSHVLEALALKEQLAARFQKEQAHYRRQPIVAGDEGG
jgi:ABC-type protease/lipase transport system fused ATPase/permease subunit